MPETDCGLPTHAETVEQVEWRDRFAENIPSYLSKEQTEARLRTEIERGLNTLWEEHDRLTDIACMRMTCVLAGGGSGGAYTIDPISHIVKVTISLDHE